MQRLKIIASSAVLLWGFLQAPFGHVHAGDSDHPHGGGLGHLHFDLDDLDESGLHWDHPSENQNAIDLAWGISTPPDHDLHLDAEGPIQPIVLANPVASSLLQVSCFHSHDPPALVSQNPRPPPA